MILFRMAFRNVMKNWRHSLAALFSVAAGFSSIVLFQGYIVDLHLLLQSEYSNRSMFANFVVENQNLNSAEGRADPWKYGVTFEQQKWLDENLFSRPEIETRARFLRVSGTISNGKTSSIFFGNGYDLEEGKKIRGPTWAVNVLYGHPLAKESPTPGIVVGQLLGHTLGCFPKTAFEVFHSIDGYSPGYREFNCEGDRLSLQLTATTNSGQANAVDLDLVGIVDGGFRYLDDKYIAMSLESAQMLLNTKDVTYITVRVRERGQVDQVLKEFRQQIQNAGLPLSIQRWDEHPVISDFYHQSLDLLRVFRNFVVVIILIIASLSVFNTLIKIVKERTREIGTLRSLGFTPGKIRKLFTIEAALLAGLGCAIGVVLSLITTFGINQWGLLYKAGLFIVPSPFTLAVDAGSYLISAFFLCALSAGTALITLSQSLQRPIAENLIYD